MFNPCSWVCCPDRVLSRGWSTALGAVGSEVKTVEDISKIEPGADLVLLRLVDPAVLQATPSLQTTPAALIVPKPDLGLMVRAMAMANSNVRAVLVEEYADVRLLAYVSSRILWGDIFGLSKALPWGVKVYSEVVNDHRDRGQVMGSIAHFANALGVRSKYRECLQLVVDELLMNALYDAPVGADGAPLLRDVAPRDRPSVRLERPVFVQFGCDGSKFAVGVRDSFGSLRRETVLQYISRCLLSKDPIERKTSGAGLGLFLVANNVTELIINLLPGVATEVIAVLDIRSPGQQIQHLGVYEETLRQDADVGDSGRRGPVASTGSPARPSPSLKLPRLLWAAMSAALVLLLAAIGLVAVPQLQRGGRGSLTVETSPPGATVYVNGVRRGQASPELRIADLEVSTPLAVTAMHSGYRESKEVVSLARNQNYRLSLRLAPLKARINVVSIPTGARISLNGRRAEQETPSVLDGLEPKKEVLVRLEKHGYLPAESRVVPTVEETLMLQTALTVAPGFSQLNVESSPPGAHVFINDVDTGKVTPLIGHVLPGDQSYTVRLEQTGRVPWEQTVKLVNGSTTSRAIDMPPGGRVSLSCTTRARARFVDPNGKVALDDALPIDRILPAGLYRVTLRGNNPFLSLPLRIQVAPGKELNRQVALGIVKLKKGDIRILAEENRQVLRVALPPGKHDIQLIDTRSGAKRTAPVQVTSGKTTDVE